MDHDNKSRATKGKSGGRAKQREEKRFSFSIKTHGGGFDLTVDLSITAAEEQTKLLLAQMPPDHSIWPEKIREEWLTKFGATAQLDLFEGAEQRVSVACTELLSAMLEFNDHAERQRLRAMPKPMLKIVGGYDSVTS